MQLESSRKEIKMKDMEISRLEKEKFENRRTIQELNDRFKKVFEKSKKVYDCYRELREQKLPIEEQKKVKDELAQSRELNLKLTAIIAENNRKQLQQQ